jgi:integrase/recombinase XerD
MWDLWGERFTSSMRTRNFSEKTINDYRVHMNFFFRYLSSLHIDKISQVTRDVIQEYQTYLYYFERAGKKLSFGTQYSKLTAVKSFFRFLVKEDYLPYDPSSAIELPKRRKNLPRGIMSVKEVIKVLETPSGGNPLSLRNRAILEVLYCTGIRNTELRCLTLFDVDMPNHQLRVRYGKGNKERIVPLGDIASRHIERYLTEGRPHIVREHPSQNLLFVSRHGKKLNASNLIWIVKKYIKKAKIGKDITPHCFRHSCASHMLKGKADLRHIQELLGHASVQTTQIYTKVELSNLKEVHKRCHPREKKGSSR